MRKTSQSVAEEAVEKGAAALDRLRPNWFRAISLDELDLADPCHCICGQLARTSRSPAVAELQNRGYNGFAAYLEWMRSRISMRFRSSELGFSTGQKTSYSALDGAWARAIRARLEASP